MKKQIFTLALSVAVGVGLAAAAPMPQDQGNSQGNEQGAQHQGWGGHRQAMNPDERAQRLSKRLKLSDEQTGQVKSILSDRVQQMQSIRQDTSLQPQDRRAKMQSLRQDTDNKIRGVLNDNQKKKYDAMEQQMQQRMQHRRTQEGNGGGGNNQ
jgi:hypothetical protein